MYRRRLGSACSRGTASSVSATLSLVPCRLSPRTPVLHASANAVHLSPDRGRARAAKMQDQNIQPPVDM